jgi:hypothetical protein
MPDPHNSSDAPDQAQPHVDPDRPLDPPEDTECRSGSTAGSARRTGDPGERVSGVGRPGILTTRDICI